MNRPKKRMSLEYTEFGLLTPCDDPYPMTLGQIKSLFGHQNHTRRNIYDGLQRGVRNLLAAGVERIALGGSYVSRKEHPRDADIAWWFNENINWNLLDSVFQSENRQAALGKYLLDQKIDGIENVAYQLSHEYFLRQNHRMPFGHQHIGIIQVVTEVQVDYVQATEESRP